MANGGIPIIQGQDPLGGLRQFFTGFTGGTLEQIKNQQLSQQLGQLFPGQNFQGIRDPRALQAAVNLGLQQQQQQGALDLQAARPLTTGQIQAAEVARIQRKPADQRTAEESEILRVARGLPTTQAEELTKTQISKNRAEAEEKLRAGKGILTPEQKISQSNVFRKEFDALSKDFRKIRDSFQRINAAAADPSAAGDLAIIFNFMKILDPGSVVRESEFATAENAAGVPDKIRNMWNKALTGERIAFNRDDFVRQAANLFKAQQGTQKNLINRYTKLSDRFGLNPQDVVTQTNKTIPTPTQFTPEQIEAELQRRGVK